MNTCDHQRRDKKIVIQRLSGTADAHGHVVETTDANWSTYEQAYASVITKGGREFWKVQQTAADVSHVWNCDWSKKLMEATPDMRLVCEGKTHNIVSVIDVDEAHMEIQIQTRIPPLVQ